MHIQVLFLSELSATVTTARDASYKTCEMAQLYGVATTGDNISLLSTSICGHLIYVCKPLPATGADVRRFSRCKKKGPMPMLNGPLLEEPKPLGFYRRQIIVDVFRVLIWVVRRAAKRLSKSIVFYDLKN